MFDDVPKRLRNQNCWIHWRWSDPDDRGKRTKLPVWFDGDQEKSRGYANRVNWCSFGRAKSNVSRVDGIGFHFKDQHLEVDPIVALDVDKCRDPETGELDDRALLYMKQFRSYTEVSPSGKGIRILIRASSGYDKAGQKHESIETFWKSGWVTITGDFIDHEYTRSRVHKRQNEFVRLQEALWPRRLKVPSRLRMSERIFRDQKMQRDLAVELMGSIDPSHGDSYAGWVEIGMCLKSIGDDSLVEVWDDWSSQAQGYKGTGEVEAKWDTFSPDGARTIYSLIFYARSNGWEPNETSIARPPAANEDASLAANTLLREFSEQDDVCKIAFANEQTYAWECGRYWPWPKEKLTENVHAVLGRNYWQASMSFTNSAAVHLKRHPECEVETLEPHWRKKCPSIARRWKLDNCLFTPTTIHHLPDGVCMDATPACFNLSTINMEIEPKARQPVRWFKFLDSIWGDHPDGEAYIDLLQRWFGYCLTSSTELQAMLLMVGPTRSGKGTIVSVLEQLVGPMNFGGAEINSLAGEHALQLFIGKRVMSFGDVRCGRADEQAIKERLLMITGGDQIPVNVKYKDIISTRLPAKIMLSANEVPLFRDESGALLARYRILRMFKSFAGKEDRHLLNDLKEELPGILNWAIEGWHATRVFKLDDEPPTAVRLKTQVRESTAPVGAWLEDCTKPGGSCTRANLYESYCDFMADCGARPVSITKFAVVLDASKPEVKTLRKRTADGKRQRVCVGIQLRHPTETP